MEGSKLKKHEKDFLFEKARTEKSPHSVSPEFKKQALRSITKNKDALLYLADK